MNGFDIAVIVVIAVAFVAAVGTVIYRKVKGKGGCDCGCSGCPHACNCSGKKKTDNLRGDSTQVN